MHITMVKKLKADGSPCAKCADVENRLRDADLLGNIDRVVIADESNLDSEGMQLARKYQVELAPFFIVENNNETKIYTVYFKFLKEVLSQTVQPLKATA